MADNLVGTLQRGSRPLVHDLQGLSSRLTEALQRDVTIGEDILLLDDGYLPCRRRHLGEAILDALRIVLYPPAGRVLGLPEAELETHEL